MTQCLLYRTDKYSFNEEFKTYLSSGFLCDFKVICSHKTYNIHKLILALACPTLRSIFEQDDRIELLNLSDFDEHEVNAFITALYQVGDFPKVAEYSNILRSLNLNDNFTVPNFPLPLTSNG